MTPPHFGLDECQGAPVGFGSNAAMYVTKGLGWWYGWSVQVTDAGVWYGSVLEGNKGSWYGWVAPCAGNVGISPLTVPTHSTNRLKDHEHIGNGKYITWPDFCGTARKSKGK